jgi:hypothetical protein
MCADRTWESSAVYPPHHACVAHCRPYCDGYLQWGSFELFDRRIRDGKSVRHSNFAGLRAFFPDAILPSCHLGDIIEYDTVSNLSWSVNLRTHAIAQVVDRLLSEPWAPAEECGREVPALKRQDDCLVCSSFLPFLSCSDR